MRGWHRIGWEWNELGRSNAMGAIITREGRPASWDLDEFLATGRADAGKFIADLERLRPSFSRGRALDFGCGIGRVTRALAEYFDSVVGVDVARSMIRRAKALNRDQVKCRFILNRAAHLRRFPDGSFDVVYSRLVLQHVPPRVVRRYLPELVRVVAPGGIVMFQLPAEMHVDPRQVYLDAPVLGPAWKRRLPRQLVRAHRRIKWVFVGDHRPQMAMYGMARSEVTERIQAAGGQIVDVRDDRSHGPGVPGYEYWITK